MADGVTGTQVDFGPNSQSAPSSLLQAARSNRPPRMVLFPSALLESINSDAICWCYRPRRYTLLTSSTCRVNTTIVTSSCFYRISDHVWSICKRRYSKQNIQVHATKKLLWLLFLPIDLYCVSATIKWGRLYVPAPKLQTHSPPTHPALTHCVAALQGNTQRETLARSIKPHAASIAHGEEED